tara:strand:- start:1371 stop:1541 length:171 start_codon:yes stop_codon:yes gene_type:complete
MNREETKNGKKWIKDIVCPKGHKKLKACLMLDDYDEYTWVDISCVTCDRTLFYNGC